MHYLGVLTEQLTHEDAQIALARRQARQRRDARRVRRQIPSERDHWWASLARDGEKGTGRKHWRLLGHHGMVAHR